jgi:hypothetical protein
MRLPPEVIGQPIPGPQSVERQFVLSAQRKAMSPRELAKERELFWYRHELLASLDIRWQEHETGRTGDVSLRHLRLTRPMLDIFKLPVVDIDFELNGLRRQSSAEADWLVQNGSFQDARITLINREGERPFCRLM